MCIRISLHFHIFTHTRMYISIAYRATDISSVSFRIQLIDSIAVVTAVVVPGIFGNCQFIDYLFNAIK